MTISDEIATILKQENVTFIASVPCSLLDELIRLVETDPGFDHVPATREEEGIGICVGAYLAGRTPAIVMQNSGLGNSINAIASLANFYQIPVVILISHRGTEGEKIGAQVPMGEATTKLLDAAGIEYKTLENAEEVEGIRDVIKRSKRSCKPTAVLLPFSFWREP